VTTSRSQRAADLAGNGEALERLAQVGLVAYGLVHLLIAWLALQLAWGGGGGGEADQSGAMATLAEQPFGKPLLWVLTVGLAALAVWQLAEVLRYRTQLRGPAEEKKKAVTKMVKAVAKAVVYAVLAVTAVRYAAGSGRSSSGQQQQTVSGVLGWPGGRVLVGIAALVLFGIGVNHVRKAVKRSFMKEIDTGQASEKERRLIERLGQVGYPAKGASLALVGGLFGWAAITFDPAKASGLDGAMHTVLSAPLGQWLLTLVALGLAAFGVFSFFRARYPQRT
jgi:hypothetical protein